MAAPSTDGRARRLEDASIARSALRARLIERTGQLRADFRALGAEVTVLNLQDEYVSVIDLPFIFPFQQLIDLPGTLL